MHPVDDATIRAAFINASRREAAQATLPELSTVEWDELDYLGWADAKKPGVSYVVIPDGDTVHAILVRPAASTGPRRKAMCAWCEDITQTKNVGMFVARRAGASGRRGNTVGTFICRDFACSAHVRRPPSLVEMGAEATPEERDFWSSLRTEELRVRLGQFVGHVLRQD